MNILSVVCLVDDEYSREYASFLGTLLTLPLYISESVSDAMRLLREAHGLLLCPSERREAELDHQLDLQSRAVDSVYLPITLSPNVLQVGPLLSNGLSCHECWQVRSYQHSGSIQHSGSVAGCLRKSTAYLAAAMTMEVVRCKSRPFASPLWKLQLSTGESSWGIVTSSPGCKLCMQYFRDTRNEHLLEQVVHRVLAESVQE